MERIGRSSRCDRHVELILTVGGGAKRRISEDDPESATASMLFGIIDVWGGLRVLVTKLEYLPHHVHLGEHCFVVHDIRLEEPVTWDAIPFCVAEVKRTIARWISTRNDYDGIDDAIKHYEIRNRSKPQRSLETTGIIWG